MSQSLHSNSVPENRLLARLPADDFQRLLPHLELFALNYKDILYEPGADIDYAYFPSIGVISMVTIMEDGAIIEVATVGAEGMACLPSPFGPATATGQFIVQVAGNSVRMKSEILKVEVAVEGPLRQAMHLYQTAFARQVVQAVACNGLHSVVQRRCRWLLMTQDRVEARRVDAHP